jgi:hypothetical protein
MVTETLERWGDDVGDELANWYVPWARVLDACRGDLDRLRAPAERAAEPPAPDGWDRTEQARKDFEAKLQTASPALGQTRAEEPPSAEVPWLASDLPATYLLAESPEKLGPTVPSDAALHRFQGRLAAAGGLLLLTGLIGWVARPPAGRLWAARWWPVVGVGLGLFWWLCLHPSILGWLMVALSLGGAWRQSPVLRRPPSG